MYDSNVTNGYAFANKVNVYLDVLRALMLNWIGGEIDDTDVVAVDYCCGSQWTV